MAYVRYCLVVFALACNPAKTSVDAPIDVLVVCKANGSTCTPGAGECCEVCVNNVCACGPVGTACGLDFPQHCCNGCDYNTGHCK
jgi:hypothetical protein